MESDYEVTILQVLVMWSTSSLVLISAPLQPGVIVAVKVSFMGQIERMSYFWH